MQAEIIQTAMGVVGSLGFALLFGIRGTKPLGCIALGSGIGWVVYLVSVAGGHEKAFGMLASSLVIAICSEVTARLIKTPVILLLVPMLIPEIPGGDLYYTMYSLIEGDSAKFAWAAPCAGRTAPASASRQASSTISTGMCAPVRTAPTSKEKSMGKNATRNDVAKLAGGSPAVVSYVINKTKFVSEEKTQAVLDAIKELNYQPNLYARSLKTNRSMQIAFVCDNLRNDWLEIAEKKLDKLGYNVSHCYSRDGDDFIQSLISGRYDAVFMLSNRYKAVQLNRIAEAGIPVVLYKTREYSHLEPNIVAVAPNLYSGVEKTVNYLVFRGHRRILFVPPLRYNMYITRGYRERGYRDALEVNGIPYDERYVCTNADTMEGVLSHVFDMVFSKSKDERATAIIAGNDFIAASIMQYVKKLGMKIPDDLAVVGTDNTYIAEMVSPTLTSIDFSKEDFSQKLVDTLMALLRGEKAQDQFLPVSLCVRESA